MLCLWLIAFVFVSHVVRLKDKSYRSLTTHQKIHICYRTVNTYSPALLTLYSPHHVLKHLAVIQPRHPTILLWLVPETFAYNIILWTQMVLGNHAAICLAFTTPLHLAQACLLVIVTNYRLKL